ncbi:MAG: hypothetical protein JSR54_08985 [Proteobacteria bacterium]|nr:hypothetical protein [Pseudomonadota bacterium]
MRFTQAANGGADGDVSATSPGSGRWYGTLLRAWRDRRYAYAECRGALQIYGTVVDECPYMRGRMLYHEIIRRCVGEDLDRAVEIVRRAEDSFAAWPAAREVRFRDVVSYVIVDELMQRADSGSIRADVERIVSKVIPVGF